MKPITLALTTYIFVSYVFDFVNAKSAILGGVTHGETSTDSSEPLPDLKKNQYTEKICRENNYNNHYLTDDCAAFCYESTIKNRASRQINLPDGTPCIGGKTCQAGTCGKPFDRNKASLNSLFRYIDKAETLKGLDPKLIAAIKDELAKFKPGKGGETNRYLKKLLGSFLGISETLPKSEQFERTH